MSNVDPLVVALVAKLPAPGSKWPASRRALWLRCMAGAMAMAYDCDADAILIEAVEQNSGLTVVRTVPVSRATVAYGSETVRVVIVRDEIWGHSAYVAQGIERDIAAQGSSPGEAMRRLAATAEADSQFREESGAEVLAAPPHVLRWYAQAPSDSP